MAELLVSGYWALEPKITPPGIEDGVISLERTGALVDGERRYDADVWAIRWMGRCYGRDGTWTFEPLPSARSEEWLANYRWTHREAMAVVA